MTTLELKEYSPIIVNDRVTYADLIKFTMLEFDIILGMDWLHKCYATIDCQNRVVRFQFPNELELEWEGRSSNLSGQINSHLKANKMLSKGLGADENRFLRRGFN